MTWVRQWTWQPAGQEGPTSSVFMVQSDGDEDYVVLRAEVVFEGEGFAGTGTGRMVESRVLGVVATLDRAQNMCIQAWRACEVTPAGPQGSQR